MTTALYYSGTLTLPGGATFGFTAQPAGTAQVTIAETPQGPVFGQGKVTAGGPTVYLNQGETVYAASCTFDGEYNTLNWAVMNGDNVMGQGVLASWLA